MDAIFGGIQLFLYFPFIPIFSVVIFAMALICFGLARAYKRNDLKGRTKLFAVGCFAVVLAIVLAIGHNWATNKLEAENKTLVDVIFGIVDDDAICTSCGKQVDTQYCGYCGTPANNATKPTCSSCGEPCDTPYCRYCGNKNEED